MLPRNLIQRKFLVNYTILKTQKISYIILVLDNMRKIKKKTARKCNVKQTNKSYTRSKETTKKNYPTNKRKTGCVILPEVCWSLQTTHVVDYQLPSTSNWKQILYTHNSESVTWNLPKEARMEWMMGNLEVHSLALL